MTVSRETDQLDQARRRRHCREVKRWTYRRARGEVFWADPEPARVHVRALMSQGMGAPAIATQVGISRSAICSLLYGCHGRPPTTRLTAEVSRRLLRAYFDLDLIGDPTPVSALGTRRRLQALVAAGYSMGSLGRQLGKQRASLRRLFYSERISAGAAREVRALYARLSDQPPPTGTKFERGAVTTARRIARERGWLVPAYWDESTLDDPNADPLAALPTEPVVDEELVTRALTGVLRLRDLNRAERVELARRVVGRGEGAWQIAALLGCNYESARTLAHQARANAEPERDTA